MQGVIPGKEYWDKILLFVHVFLWLDNFKGLVFKFSDSFFCWIKSVLNPASEFSIQLLYSSAQDWSFPCTKSVPKVWEKCLFFSKVWIPTQTDKGHEETGSIVQSKKQNKSSENDPEEMEVCELPEKEFAIIIIKMPQWGQENKFWTD